MLDDPGSISMAVLTGAGRRSTPGSGASMHCFTSCGSWLLFWPTSYVVACKVVLDELGS
jgi:hypothetical protein